MNSKVKLLLIEDNPTDVALVDVYLKEAFPGNYILVRADHLSKGLEFLTSGDFDAVICDLALPDSYGIATFQKIFSTVPEIPVIVFTGHGDDAFGAKAVAKGAADFINKGELNGNLLRRSIIYSIERSNLTRQLAAHINNLERSEKKFRALFEDSKDAIYVRTPAGQFLDFNKATTELFGYTDRDMRKINVERLYVNPEDRRKIEETLEKYGSVKDYEVKKRRKDGTILTCIVTATRRKAENDETQYLMIVRDVTELRQVEALRRAKEVAEETAHARQEFLSVMSHEIRTPLNAIISVAQLLVSESPKKSQLKHLDILRFSAKNLLGLVNNILDFSKIESGKIEIEKINFDFSLLAKMIVESFTTQAEAKGIRLKLFLDPEIPQILSGDPMRLTQVLDNLIANAIKFTDEGKVTLKIESILSDDESTEVMFEVSDTGTGIEKHRQEEIFESYKQVHPTMQGKYGGTGLGLAISKRLVEVMGGKIFVESEPGRGSTFRFNLRFNKTEKAAEEQNISFLISRKSTLQGINILLAEDNSANQVLIKRFLTRWGARVDIASNGEETVNKIKKKKYDLILLDLQMPVMDGYEASTTIRAMGYSIDELPIIAITAYAMTEDKIEVLNHGMNDYISKPINPEELHQKIVKSVSEKFLRGAENINDLQGDTTSLKTLVESFKDEPDFIRRYLSEFENEFTQLPLNAVTISKNKDVESLERLIHKSFPSIKRTEHPLLRQQLDSLKEMLSDKEPLDENIFQLTGEIQKSCEDVIAQIKTLQEEYLGEAVRN